MSACDGDRTRSIGVAALLVLGAARDRARRARRAATPRRLWREPRRHADARRDRAAQPVRNPAGTVDASTLPLGLPWLGAHFRIDALAAFFLVVVNLGGAAASLFALGYGRHEDAPQRVLPFYPAFLAGMNLVVLADDAFTFLVSWEFMSLTSWALVMAHHRDPRQRARRLRLSADGELRHAGAAARLRPARRRRRRLRLRRDPRRASVRRARRRWC